MKKVLCLATSIVLALATGGRVLADNGTWIFNGTGNWSDTMRWSGGIVADGADYTADFSSLDITNNRTITLDRARTIGNLKFGDTAARYYTWTLETLDGSSYVLTLDVSSNAPTVTVTSKSTATIDVILAGNDGLTKAGAGILQLGNKSNYYTGTTTVSEGTLRLRISDVIPDSSPVQIAAKATLDMNTKNETVHSLSGEGTVTSETGTGTFTLTVGSNDGSGAFSGVIVGGVSERHIAVTKIGSGTQTLSGNNTYTGATTVSGGILVAGNAGALGASTLTVNSGGTLAVANGITLNKAATFNTGSTLAGLGTYRPAATFSVASGVHVAPGIADGANNVGTLTIGYTSNETNTTFGSGSYLDIDLARANADRLNITGTVAVTSGANLTFNTIGAPTAGKYTLLTASKGTFSNNFTATAPSGYRLAMNAANNGLDLIHQATIGAITANAGLALITGGSVAFTFTVENSAPTDSDDLVFSVLPGTNTAGTVSGARTVAAQRASGAVSGLSFNGTTVGLGQTGVFYVLDSNASNSPQEGNVTVDVYDHASGEVESTTLSMPDVILGYSGPVVSASSITVSNASGTRVNLKTTNNGPTGNLSLGDVSGVAAGGSDTITASLASGQAAGAYSQGFTLTYADDSGLNGASNNLGSVDITISGMVLDHSNASFLPTNQDTLTIDFGTLPVGGVVTLPFDIWNLVTMDGYTAKLDLDSVVPSGDTAALYTELAPFTDQAAGTASSWTAYFDTSIPGSFSATYTLYLSDEDLPGEAGQILYLTLQGNATLGTSVPEPVALSLVALALLALRRRTFGQ